MRGQQTCPRYNIYLYHVNSKVGRQHTKASLPLSAHLWGHDVNDVATPPGSKSPSLLERWCGFFYVPQEQLSVSATMFGPYPRRLESRTVCRCYYKGSTFFYPECWPGPGLNSRPPAQKTGALPTELTMSSTSCNVKKASVLICWLNWFIFREVFAQRSLPPFESREMLLRASVYRLLLRNTKKVN